MRWARWALLGSALFITLTLVRTFDYPAVILGWLLWALGWAYGVLTERYAEFHGRDPDRETDR